MFLALAVMVVGGVRMAPRYRPLVVRSDSMSPGIRTGDVIVTRMVRPGQVHVGDVVTFQDPSRAGELVTHRVTEMNREAGSFSFATRGDANTGVERWSVGSDGALGTLALRVPRAGSLTNWLATPWVCSALFVFVALFVGYVTIRWIWAHPSKPASRRQGAGREAGPVTAPAD